MSLRLPTLLSAAVLAAAPVAATAVPASAATCTAPVVSTKVGPRTVVVGTTGTTGFDVLVGVVAGGCTISDVTAVVTTPSKNTAELTLTPLGTEDEVSLYGARLEFGATDLANADAGRWRVRTTTQWLENTSADDSDDSDDDSDDDAGDDSPGDDSPGDDSPGDGGTDTSARSGLHSGGDDDGDDDAEDTSDGIVENAKVDVLAASELKADVASSQLKKGKIRKGRSLTITGVLTRANWEAARLDGYAKQKVELQFRTDKGRYKKVQTLKTRAGGSFAETVKAKQDGCYRLVFRGSKTTAATPSSAECIDVR